MEYGRIHGVDKPVSRLVQGTVYFRQDHKDDWFALCDAVVEQGGNAFDTPFNYGGGVCETVLGEWMAARGNREDIVVLGKGCHPIDGTPRVTPEDLTSDLMTSLERQQSGYIDLYVLHRDNEEVPVGPIVEELNRHFEAGWIRAFGGSNWTADRIDQANAYAAAHGLEPMRVTSPNFSLAVQIQPPWKGCISVSGERGRDDRDYYRTHGIPMLPWSSLAGGFFSGRFTRDNVDEIRQHGDYFEKLAVETYCDEANFTRLDRVRDLAGREGMTVPQVAMAYVMSQPQDIFALVGCRNGKEYAENAAVLNRRLTPAECDWLDLSSDDQPW